MFVSEIYFGHKEWLTRVNVGGGVLSGAEEDVAALEGEGLTLESDWLLM